MTLFALIVIAYAAMHLLEALVHYGRNVYVSRTSAALETVAVFAVIYAALNLQGSWLS